eukprot:3415519-Pyramimonas_sp.AAC.1
MQRMCPDQYCGCCCPKPPRYQGYAANEIPVRGRARTTLTEGILVGFIQGTRERPRQRNMLLATDPSTSRGPPNLRSKP